VACFVQLNPSHDLPAMRSSGKLQLTLWGGGGKGSVEIRGCAKLCKLVRVRATVVLTPHGTRSWTDQMKGGKEIIGGKREGKEGSREGSQKINRNYTREERVGNRQELETVHGFSVIPRRKGRHSSSIRLALYMRRQTKSEGHKG